MVIFLGLSANDDLKIVDLLIYSLEKANLKIFLKVEKLYLQVNKSNILWFFNLYPSMMWVKNDPFK
jgi:hypothetical protein